MLLSVYAGTHEETGTEYGIEGVQRYATHKHGPDGDIFLDPYLMPFIQQSRGLTLIDVGCGAGPWSIQAAKYGANVTCIDIQSNMIDLARQNAKKEKIKTIKFTVGDSAALPYPENTYDRAMSINVGCNIPSSTDRASGLNGHFIEIARVLKKGGKLILTAPASFDILFTTNQADDDFLEQINTVLKNMPLNPKDHDISLRLNQLDKILRASFKLVDNHLELVRSEEDLTPGDKIWRKIPGLTVPNYYHPDVEYLESAKSAGLKVISIQKPTFQNKKAWFDYHAAHEQERGLSELYIDHYPFIIFQFEKV